MVGFDYLNTKEVDIATKLKLPVLTTTERNNLIAVLGMLIYNSTTESIETYDGSNWVEVGGGITDHTQLTNIGTTTHENIDAFISNTTTDKLGFNTSGAEVEVVAIGGGFNGIELDSDKTLQVIKDPGTATSINALEGGTEGQIFIIRAGFTGAPNTISFLSASINIVLQGTYNFTGASDYLVLIKRSIGGNPFYFELSRMNFAAS